MNNAYIRAQQCKVKEAKFPFVKIGSQYWTTKNLSLAVTPQGNTIPEVQAGGNVERITNIADREFSSDTGFWIKNTGITISGGVCNFATGGSAQLYNNTVISIAKYYKVVLTISGFSAGVIDLYVSSSRMGRATANGTYTFYGVSTQTQFAINSPIATSCSIDNISIQEIGWSGSQELYDGIYAQTSGTVEQKTYAAVKAAAMWCNYNNDAPTGLIYGKLYNWFAVKLFQMDIDYYNAANTDKKWASGFRIPTQAEFQTLSTYLGGDAVSGGHLKEAGLEHWGSPNTGADNSSGFSALGGGKRLDDGTLQALKFDGICWTITDNELLANRLYIAGGTTAVDYIQTSKKRGYSIRLIKA